MRTKRLVLPLVGLLCAIAAQASTVDSVSIRVLLDADGTAHVTEHWGIRVEGDITEWYLVMQNLGAMQLQDFGVSEDGTAFEREAEWDIHRSRQQKRQRCGLVEKSGGYELCWGIGSNGPHLFDVSYRLTGLVRGFADADGFNHMFIARGMSDAPNKARISIARTDGQPIDTTTTRIWGFGFYGDIELRDGQIVAQSSQPFERRSAMIVMAQFKKGFFAPALTSDANFEDVKQRAFEGSDYGEEEEELTWWQVILLFVAIPLGMLTAPYIGYYLWFYLTLTPLRRKWQRERLGVSKLMPYWREKPQLDNLRIGHKVMDKLKYSPKSENVDEVIGAYLVRLLSKKWLSIETYDEANNRLQPALHVNDKVTVPTVQAQATDNYFESALYHIIRQAAGQDGILQERELKRWARQNTKELHTFYKTMKKANADHSDMQSAAQLFGLKKFLQDFSLIGERNVTEVALWDEYLVYAQLFGIAKQVQADLKRIAPEYTQLSQVAQALEQVDVDGTFIPIWAHTINQSSQSAYAQRETAIASAQARRTGGFGGGTSFGGGGGFSGGGFGGGGR